MIKYSLVFAYCICIVTRLFGTSIIASIRKHAVDFMQIVRNVHIIGETAGKTIKLKEGF